MEKVILEVKDQEYENQLMSHLKGEVFHLTTMKAFRDILKTKAICNNMNGQFPINCGSANSFGRSQGWVCFFDFRGKSDTEIQETVIKYNFFRPSWFWQYLKEYKTLSIVYLILNNNCHHEIIPNTVGREIFRATDKYQHFVPDTECWFPDSVSINKIRKAVFLKLHESAPSDEVLKALYMIEYRQRKLSNKSIQWTSCSRR